MSAWIIARPLAPEVDGESLDEIVWEYWCGHASDCGQVTSLHRSDAYHFPTHQAALACTDTHAELRDSGEWRIRRADGNALRSVA